MSLINKTNRFKNNRIGSVKDFKDKYKYDNAIADERYNYSYNNKERYIREVNQDNEIFNAELQAKITKSSNMNKIKIVQDIINLHIPIIILFSTLSSVLSCYGVILKFRGQPIAQFCVLILTMILLLGVNIGIQPKLIASLRFKKSISNIIGSSVLAIVCVAVFTISIITNKITLNALHITDGLLPWAFTFGFDLSSLGLNFLRYSSALFDVNDNVKSDLNLDIQNNNMDIQPKNKPRKTYISDINAIIDNAKPGELLEYKQGSKFSSGSWNRALNKRTDVIKVNGKYYKKGAVVVNE